MHIDGTAEFCEHRDALQIRPCDSFKMTCQVHVHASTGTCTKVLKRKCGTIVGQLGRLCCAIFDERTASLKK